MGAYVCGIDIGNFGVKVIILRKDGFVSARGLERVPEPIIIGNERFQEAQIWWEKVLDALKYAINALVKAGGSPEEICSICIDATSGTIVPVDEEINPVYTGIMYNDGRAVSEAEYLNKVGSKYIDKLGYKFNSSFALPKILHIKENYYEVWKKARYILHQADYIAIRFMGKKGRVVTDTSNALKTGYDILESKWPKYISEIGIEEKLPQVVPIGTDIGLIDEEIAKSFGFSKDLKIVAGMTDSVAACVASGARNPGDMNTTIGSTITWKVLSPSIVYDKSERVYSHLHPSKCFLPGGAGNAGGLGIKSMLDSTPDEMTNFAAKMKISEPSDCFGYPLPSKGERYPFLDSEFSPFLTNNNCRGKELYKVLIEGAACIERMGYRTLESMGALIDGQVWTTGGGAMVDIWMQIRANVLNRVVIRSRYPESAYGVALIAAMRTWFDGDFVKTADNFILEQSRFEPESRLAKMYDEYYHKFVETVEKNRNLQ
jgi:xylulokinase